MRFLVFMLLLCMSCGATAGEVNKLAFFGDSLSDNGKLYELTLHVIPKSPPYYNGRFSNGPTWAEDVAKYYYDKNYTESSNFAWSGATTVFHMPNSKFLSVSTLEIQIAAYIVDTLFKDRSHTLHIIWIGANDYFYALTNDMDQLSSEVTNKIDWAIRILQYYGSEHFLILNLPDLGRTPYANNSNWLHNASILHNAKLQALLDQFQIDYPTSQVLTMDLYKLLNNLIDNPEIYNKKFNMNITDTTTACWDGGFFLNKVIDKEKLMLQIQEAFREKNGALTKDFDASGLANMIMSSPELAYTYKLGESLKDGNTPCTNPNEHIFWDKMHPSAILHQVLSLIAEETIGDAV